MKKFNLKLIIFSVLIFSLLSSSQVFGAKLGELLDRAAKSGLQEAMTPLVREAERLAKEFEQGKKKIEEVTRNITPTQALNVVSTATNLPSSVKDFFQKIIAVGTKPSTSQTSTTSPSPSGVSIPSWKWENPTPSQPSQPSTQPSPTQLIKPEGASSLSKPSSSSSQQPTQQPSNAQLLQEFRELESQSMQQTTTTTRTTHKIEKVKRYYCNRATAQCVYSVYNAIPQYDKPPYYKTLAECQANCKKAPYVCYRYVLSTGCSMQCTPYASDTPCKNECTPSGTPIQGTAQQQQQTTQHQQTTQQQQSTQSQQGYYQSSQSSQSQQSTPSGWQADPYYHLPRRTCIRQEGQCPTSSNCLSCPSGYYKHAGGCSCTCRTPKVCNCYITCCTINKS
ncbi:MAG: hypothetical protein AB7D02_02310 [Candidatus Paceibacterota bacterium]